MLKQKANELIPVNEGKKVLVKSNGVTKDIVAEVIQCFKDSRQQLVKFAPHLAGNNLQQTLFNVWNFWKFNISYKVDPPGVQWIQTPAALWHRKEGDCKSLSVAVMCSLHALGIKAAFRFTSYSTAIDYPTHVYVVVLCNGKEIPVDCVWKEFGTQKTFTQKWDYNMSEIYRLSGIDDSEVGKLRFGKVLRKINPLYGAAAKLVERGKARRKNRRGTLQGLDVYNDRIDSHTADLMLDKQAMEMEQILAARVHGIGSVYDNSLEVGIAAAHNAIAEIMGWPTVSVSGFDTVDPEDRYYINGDEEIDGIAGKAKRQQRKLNKATKANAAGKAVSKKQAKLLTKAGVAVKKVKEGLLKRVAKGIKKVLTTPARLAIKTQLPKNAPFFLYLYITDPRVLAKLPEAVNTKRQKAITYKNKIVNGLQMTESNFDKTVRNGIMNAFGKSPEEVIAQWMKDANFSVGIITAVLGAAANGLKALLGKMGENIKEDIANFSPAPEDWGTINQGEKYDLATAVQQQPTNNDPASQYYRPSVPVNILSQGADTTGSNALYSNAGSNPGDATGDTDLNNSKTLPGVNVSDGDNVPEEKSGNTMLWVALGLGTVLALSSAGRSGKKK